MRPCSASIDVRSGKRSIRAVLLLIVAAASTTIGYGCGTEEAARYSRTKYGNDQSATKSEPAPASSAADKAADSGSERGKLEKLRRKIIYDARIDLVVDSLNATEQAISRLIEEHEGFLAESDQSSLAQNQRRATWRVRMPVAHFQAFTSAVARLGEVRQNHVGSQDVTEEYMDLDARIRNKREEEKRLLKHLADSTGKLDDILAVEKELSRVRGEAEQLEGRLRYLADRAELSTVTIEANEWKDYKPPVAATFTTQVGRTFFASVETLVEFGRALALIVVALAPWLPLIVIGLLVIRWLIRHGQRRARPVAFTPATRS
jgi:uncharacterized protein DUF4349